MPFEFDGKADIKSINIRKGSSDDSRCSLDIKIHIENVSPQSAAAALGADSPETIEQSLFRSMSEDAERTAKFMGLKGLQSNASWEGKHNITIRGQRRVRCHKVGKIVLLPRAAGKFDLTCSVVIQDPPSGYLDTIKEFINHEIGVKLEHDTELNLQGGGKSAPKSKQTDDQASLQLDKPLKSPRARGAKKSGVKPARKAVKKSQRARSSKKKAA